MRIAFFTEGYDPYTNGVVVLVKAYRDALVEAGHDVTIFAPEHEEQPDTEHDVVRLKSLVFHKDFYRIVRPFSRINTVFDPTEFDVIHSHHPFTCGHIAGKLSKKHGIPLVYTFHTHLTKQAEHVRWPKTVVKSGMLELIKFHCEQSHCITTSTQVCADWLEENGVSTPISIIRPNLPKLTPSTLTREEAREKFGLRPDETVALCASRLSPEKGVEFLFESMAKLDRPPKLLLAGDGVMREDLVALSKKLKLQKHISWVGELPHHEISEAYVASDFLVFPSRNDTLGLVILEAMSYGLPVLGIDENGPSEIIRTNVDGVLVSYDTAAFARELHRMTHDLDHRRFLASNAEAGCREFCNLDVGASLIHTYGIAMAEFAKRATAAKLTRTKPPKRPFHSKGT